MRRSRHDPTKQAYYFVFCTAGTTLAELAGVAGLHWTIEECFKEPRTLGLDHSEARSWYGWHRQMRLATAAAEFLAKLAAELRRTAWSKPSKTSPSPPIAA